MLAPKFNGNSFSRTRLGSSEWQITTLRLGMSKLIEWVTNELNAIRIICSSDGQSIAGTRKVVSVTVKIWSELIPQ
jgi:hypothetical protein